MGFGQVNGRPVMIYTWILPSCPVLSATRPPGSSPIWLIWPGKERIPLIGMMDSAGERLSIRGGYAGLNGLACLIKNYCHYSGVIPRIMMLLGPCTGTMAPSRLVGFPDHQSEYRLSLAGG